MLRRSIPRACSVRKNVETSVRNITNDVLRPLDHFKAFVPQFVYATPMVLVLGNHSAGKSTLVNSLLDMEEQQTGVAPVDDGFTIIMRAAKKNTKHDPGEKTADIIEEADNTEDGPTAVASPRYGLTELKALGNVFVNRLKVKTRRLPDDAKLPHDMMLVDSPGMIDAPSGYGTHNSDPELQKIPVEVRHRGYDFLAATKWFAQRADVILLMFDPANPGTTSETLSVLTHSLQGQEHKFLILFNKVDVFDKVNDFARAYATLCWNLSKVIPLKDIPKIYTTFTPTGREHTIKNAAVPMDELQWTRGAVRDEILRAPSRRMDNLLTETEEAARRLLLCGAVCNALKKSQNVHYWNRMAVLGASTILAPVAVVGLFMTTAEILPAAALAAVSAGGIAYMWKTATANKAKAERDAIKNMDSIVYELFPGKVLTEELRQRWFGAVKPCLEENANSPGSGGIDGLPTFSPREMRRVEDILENALPQLRKQVDEYKRRGGGSK